jgi:hypothetical protein
LHKPNFSREVSSLTHSESGCPKSVEIFLLWSSWERKRKILSVCDMLVFLELKSIVKLFRLLYVSFLMGIHVDILNLLLDQEELSNVHILHAFGRFKLFTGTLSNIKLNCLPKAIVVDVVH